VVLEQFRDFPPVVESEALLLSTDQEVIHARKAIDARALDVGVIESIRTVNWFTTDYSKCLKFSVRSRRTVCRSYQQESGSPPAPHKTHQPTLRPAGIISASLVCYLHSVMKTSAAISHCPQLHSIHALACDFNVCLYIDLPSVIVTQTGLSLIRFRDLGFISISYLSHEGTRWNSWLSYYATNRKVAGSILH
jgi:hypothetical protein